MPDPSFVILYVDSPPDSVAFYSALESSVMLGLWSRRTVQPAASTAGASGELAFRVANAEVVQGMHADWSRRGLKITQVPTDMDFGRTFVALDPDGYRLRVFAPSAP